MITKTFLKINFFNYCYFMVFSERIETVASKKSGNLCISFPSPT